MPKHVFYDLSYSTTMGKMTKKWLQQPKKMTKKIIVIK
jgi:hypothetical protein